MCAIALGDLARGNGTISLFVDNSSTFDKLSLIVTRDPADEFIIACMNKLTRATVHVIGVGVLYDASSSGSCWTVHPDRGNEW